MSASAAALEALTARVGSELGVSDWVTVDQAMIDAFAEVTGDHQWIHTDPVRASQTPFGGTIAHGFLTLSLASRLAQQAVAPPEGVVMGVNYGLDRVRFLAPVRSGSRLRGRFVLEAVRRRDAVSLLRTVGLTVEMEDSPGPALAATWLGLSVFAD